MMRSDSTKRTGILVLSFALALFGAACSKEAAKVESAAEQAQQTAADAAQDAAAANEIAQTDEPKSCCDQDAKDKESCGCDDPVYGPETPASSISVDSLNDTNVLALKWKKSLNEFFGQTNVYFQKGKYLGQVAGVRDPAQVSCWLENSHPREWKRNLVAEMTLQFFHESTERKVDQRKDGDQEFFISHFPSLNKPYLILHCQKYGSPVTIEEVSQAFGEWAQFGFYYSPMRPYFKKPEAQAPAAAAAAAPQAAPKAETAAITPEAATAPETEAPKAESAPSAEATESDVNVPPARPSGEVKR